MIKIIEHTLPINFYVEELDLLEERQIAKAKENFRFLHIGLVQDR